MVTEQSHENKIFDIAMLFGYGTSCKNWHHTNDLLFDKNILFHKYWVQNVLECRLNILKCLFWLSQVCFYNIGINKNKTSLNNCCAIVMYQSQAHPKNSVFHSSHCYTCRSHYCSGPFPHHTCGHILVGHRGHHTSHHHTHISDFHNVPGNIPVDKFLNWERRTFKYIHVQLERKAKLILIFIKINFCLDSTIAISKSVIISTLSISITNYRIDNICKSITKSLAYIISKFILDQLFPIFLIWVTWHLSCVYHKT